MLFETPPKNWQISTLGEICQEGGGDIQTGPFGSQLHASDYVISGIPSIMPANIKDGRVSEDGIARITEEDAKRLSKYLTKAGDIVYSRRGDVERCALIRKREEGWLCGTGCLRVRPGSEVVDPDFCSHFLSHPETKEWISRHAVGATMPNLNTQILSALPVLLPSLQEQKAIAHILGTLDDKIELNRKTNETLEAMAKALFKSWFVDFDPVRAKAEGRPTGLPAEISDLFPDSFEDSELGEIPSGWRISSVSDVCETTDYVANGSFATLKRNVERVDAFSGSEALLLRFTDFNRDWKGDFSFITRESFEFLSKSKVLPGDVVICNVGEVGAFFRAPYLNLPMSLGPNSVLFKDFESKSRLTREYFYFLIGTNAFQANISAISSGSVQTKFNKTSLRAVPVLLPSNPLIRISSDFFESILSKVDSLFCETRTLVDLRDALLPKLISGEIRIPDAEKMLEEVGI